MSSKTEPGSATGLGTTGTEVGRSAARYLYAVADLSEGRDGRVSTGAVRERLGVTPASATEMLSKLDDRGLLDHEKYRGVSLTPRGETVVTAVAWRFCAVSTFFDSVLDATLDDETAFGIAVTLPADGVFGLRELADGTCLNRCPDSIESSDGCEW